MDKSLRDYLVNNDLLSMLYGLIIKDDSGKICYARTTEGGHEQCPVPFEFITEDEKERIVNEIVDYYEDSSSDYNENEKDDEEPYELNIYELYDWFDEIIDLIKELSEKEGK